MSNHIQTSLLSNCCTRQLRYTKCSFIFFSWNLLINIRKTHKVSVHDAIVLNWWWSDSYQFHWNILKCELFWVRENATGTVLTCFVCFLGFFFCSNWIICLFIYTFNEDSFWPTSYFHTTYYVNKMVRGISFNAVFLDYFSHTHALISITMNCLWLCFVPRCILFSLILLPESWNFSL